MKSLLVYFLIAFCLTACISNNPSKNVSAEEKALVYLEMGVRYMDINQLKTAKESLEKALDLDSNNANVHDALAVLYEKIQVADLAKKHYQLSLKLEPENPQTQNNYGRFLCDQGRYQEAMTYLTNALNMPLNNRKWFALTNAGRCLLKQEDKNQAENYFRQALQLQSDYEPALAEMFKIAYDEGNYLSATAFLQRYHHLSSATAESLWYAMQTEYALGHKAAAEQYKNRLLSEFSTSDEAKRITPADSR